MKDFACRGCLKVSRNQRSNEAHERNCPKMKLGKHESFLKRERPPVSTVPYGKVALPPSQSSKSSNVRRLPVIQSGLEDLMKDTGNGASNTTEPDALHSTPNPDIDINVSNSSQPTDSKPPENGEQEAANQNQTADTEDVEDPNCPICRVDVAQDAQGIICEMCHTWSHRACLFMPEETFQALSNSSESWFCATCQSVRANKIKWGAMEGEVTIKTVIKTVYEEIITWRKNLFMVPRGKAGTAFIKELTRLISLFNSPNKWTRVALAKVSYRLCYKNLAPSQKQRIMRNILIDG